MARLSKPVKTPASSQLALQIASIVNLVAAELGVAIVPISMMHVRATGLAYRHLAGQSPTPSLLSPTGEERTGIVDDPIE